MLRFFITFEYYVFKPGFYVWLLCGDMLFFEANNYPDIKLTPVTLLVG